MCRIKTGDKIRTKEDVVNLVTAILLRQTKAFDIPQVTRIIEHYLNGSGYQISSPRLKNIILEDIDVMKSHSVLRCQNGIYYPLDI